MRKLMAGLRRFGAAIGAAFRRAVDGTRSLVRRQRIWRAGRKLRLLQGQVALLPTQDQTAATTKRIRYYEAHLREGASWSIGRRVLEMRLMADENIRALGTSARLIRRITALNPSLEIEDGLAEELGHVVGEPPQCFQAAQEGLWQCSSAWREVAKDARKIRNPVLATQAFSNVSDRSGLEVVSLIAASLFMFGAVQMLYFYRAAADQFVFAYWVWDDIVIQAINMAPILAVVLLAAEVLFRFLRGLGERLGRLWAVLFIVHHPMVFAVVLVLLLMGSASFWGYWRGLGVWEDFKETGGNESATMLDRSILKNVHLVGTTATAAVFLQKASKTTSVDRKPPSYVAVTKEVVCALPLLRCDIPAKDSSYVVYVVDRDKVICHAEGLHCVQLPERPAAAAATPEEMETPDAAAANEL